MMRKNAMLKEDNEILLNIEIIRVLDWGNGNLIVEYKKIKDED